MHYLQCIFIWLIATSYSCANPIPSENEAESEKVANDTHRGIIAEDKALELESILERENQMISTLKDISINLKTFTASIQTSTPELDWREFFPTKFSEFFEIFALLIHKKWHHELIETVEEVGEKVEETENTLENILERPRQRQSVQGSPINIMRQLASSLRE